MNEQHTSTEILQWNCNGLSSQYEELQLLINDFNPNIITLQKHKQIRTEI